MANKRIELEHYRYYIDLLEEEPNRKRVRRGFITCAIVMMLLALGLLVLAVLSNDLSTNPQNVLQKPSPKSATSPSSLPQSPSIPTSPSVPGGRAPGGVSAVTAYAGGPALAYASDDIGLLAQVSAPTSTPIPTSPSSLPTSTSPTPTPTSSSSASQKPTGPGSQTKGVGNLSNLAKGAGQRGLEIYALVIFIGLVVLLYMGTRAVRREGKAK